MCPIEDGASIVSRLPGTNQWNLEVLGTVDISASIRQITLATSGLGSLSYEPGQDIMVKVHFADGRPTRRRYTIRRVDRQGDSLDIQVLLHGNGPGAAWAAHAGVGDTVEAIGPRGKIFVAKQVRWHLFAGDEAALPVTAAMIESLPKDSDALVAVAGDSITSSDPLVRSDGKPAAVTEVPVGSTPDEQQEYLLGAIGDLTFPTGIGHAYVNGELHLVGALRDLLISKGLDASQIDTKSYWRAGLPNEERGEPKRD